MAFQRGSLKQVRRKEGLSWVLRFRTNSADGRRVENTLTIGLVSTFPKQRDAWREVDAQGLLTRINNEPSGRRLLFKELAEHYLMADFGVDAIRPKSEKTISNVQHLVRDYLIPRFGSEIAEDLKPLEVQRYCRHLHSEEGLAWPTISKIRGIMLRIYKVGILHSKVTKNPVAAVETRSKTDYRPIVLSPMQTLGIIQILTNTLHRILVFTCACTALRASELLALRWSDILWDEGRIRISKRWLMGKDGPTKTDASDGYVPMHPILASHLQAWRRETPYSKDTDFVFPSLRMEGKVPLSPAVFVNDHLRKAALAIGVAISKGQRFGLHNLRHSLSNWMVNKAKVEPKTVQGILRHSRIQTTMDLYTQDDVDEARAAQGLFLAALEMPTRAIQ